MSDPFIGEIRIFGFNYAPVDWQFCNGSLLAIAQNSALFALLGTTYGGDGRSNFGLPNLLGRVPLCMGNGPGLSPRPIGTRSGAETVALTVGNLPAHTHAVQISATASNATSSVPATGAYLAKGIDGGGGDANIYYSGATPPLVNLSGGTAGPAGSNQPFGIMNPFLALNFCIALIGLFPSRP